MDVEEFLRTRPCLEEVEGYLAAIKHQIGNPALYHKLQYTEVNADLLGPLEKYRALLMSGKMMPAETKLKRQWTYKLKQKPKRTRITSNEPDGSPPVPPVRPTDGGTSVAGAGQPKVGQKVFRADRRKP